MPIGGERIGSAYVRIFGDGSGLPDDIRDALTDAEPAVKAKGRRLGEIYADEFNSGIVTRAQAREFGQGLRENLERAIGEGDLTNSYFESEDWKRFNGRLREEFGEAGSVAGRQLQERFQAAGSGKGLSDAIRDIIPQVRKATEEIQRTEQEALQKQREDRDRAFDQETERLADLARLQAEAAEEDVRRTREALAQQQADRDRDFDRETERLAELARLQTEAAEEDVRRTRDLIAQQQADRDKDFDLNVARLRREVEAEEEINIARFRAFREYSQRTRSQVEDLAAALNRLGTSAERSSDSQRDIIRQIRVLQNSLSTLPAGTDRDNIEARIRALREEATNATPAADRFSRSMRRLADAVGAGTGRGARNNFVNAVGSITRGLTNLVTLGPRIAFQVGSKMANAFQDAGSTGAGFGQAMLVLGGAAVSGAASLALLGGAVVLLITVLGPVAALISGITAALIGLVSTITLGAIAGVVGLVGSLGILVTGVGVAALAIGQMSDEMKDRLEPAIDDVKDAFGRLGESAGDAIGPGLLDALRDVAPAIDRLKPLTDAVAESLGNVAREYAEGFNSDGFSRFIEQVGPFTARQIERLGTAFRGFAEGAGGFFIAAKPLISDFVGGLRDIGLEFSEYANSRQGREEIRAFLDRASNAADSLGGFLSSATGALGELLDAGADSGNTLFDDLAGAFDKYAAYLRDPANAGAITDFFANGIDVARDLGNAVEFVVDVIGDLDTEKTRGQLQDIFDTMGDLSNAARTLIPLVETLGGAFGILSGTAKGIYDVAEAIVTFPADAINAIGRGLDGIFNPGNPVNGSEKSLADLKAEADGAGTTVADVAEVIRGFGGTLDEAEGRARDLASSLGDVSGAATEATRELIGQSVTEAGLSLELNSLGLSTRDVINATLGRRDAIKRVNDAINNGSELDKRAGERLLDFIGIQKETISESRKQILTNERNAQSFESLRDSISQDLRLKLESEGIEPTRRGLAKVVTEYEELDTRKNIKKLIELTGVDTTVGQVKKVIENLEDFDNQKPKPKLAVDDIEFNRDTKNALGVLGDLDFFRADPALNLDVGGFFSNAASVRGEVTNLDNLRATIDIVANRVGNFSPFGADGGTVGEGTLNPDMFAGMMSGGTVSGPRYPYGDRDLYRLAPGEEVISNRFGQADKNRDLLKAINAGMPVNVGGGGKTIDASGWVIQSGTADAGAVANEVLNELMARTF